LHGHKVNTSGGKTDPFDLVRSGIVPMTVNKRTKITYVLAKRDQGIIWDLQTVLDPQNANNEGLNSPVAVIAFENNTPAAQCGDVYTDVRLVRWRYSGAPSASRPKTLIEQMNDMLQPKTAVVVHPYTDQIDDRLLDDDIYDSTLEDVVNPS